MHDVAPFTTTTRHNFLPVTNPGGLDVDDEARFLGRRVLYSLTDINKNTHIKAKPFSCDK